MQRYWLAAILVNFITPVAVAQTKISASLQCGKPDDQHMIAVGDHPNHSLGVEHFKCTWTKPLEIAGTNSKDGVSTAFDEVTGTSFRVRGYHVSNMANGDKFYVYYGGEGALKEGVAQSLKGAWIVTGGNGKVKGLRGKGTYECTAAGEVFSCNIEGEYQLPK